MMIHRITVPERTETMFDVVGFCEVMLLSLVAGAVSGYIRNIMSG